MVVMNWQEQGRNQSLRNLRYYLSIYVEGIRKTAKIFRPNSPSYIGDLSRTPPNTSHKICHLSQLSVSSELNMP